MMTQSNVVENCTHCGLCREVCLVEKLGGHTITSLLSGGDAYSAWLCSCCQLCQEVCPEGVDIHQVMVSERRREPAPERHRRSFENVLHCGYALIVDDEIQAVRAAQGLDPVELISIERLRLLLDDL
jgi:heterodisulfide reductase subunit C